MNILKKEAGQVEITFTYNRHIGPKFIHGSVKLKFDSLQPYSFTSYAVWSETDNYEKHVREGVEKALIELTGSLKDTKVTLVEINFDEIASAPIGFQFAAYVATYNAFFSIKDFHDSTQNHSLP
jgi:hypothetical protein